MFLLFPSLYASCLDASSKLSHACIHLQSTHLLVPPLLIQTIILHHSLPLHLHHLINQRHNSQFQLSPNSPHHLHFCHHHLLYLHQNLVVLTPIQFLNPPLPLENLSEPMTHLLGQKITSVHYNLSLQQNQPTILQPFLLTLFHIINFFLIIRLQFLKFQPFLSLIHMLRQLLIHSV